MRALFIFSIVASMCSYTNAQFQHINWVLGDSIGLNFSNDPPTFFETGIRTYETNACISDAKGNLLFYTNGGQIWNKNHLLMSNGSGLDIPGYPLGNVTQGAIIIPVPLNDHIYYLIQKSYPFKYSVIDMNLLDGSGKVIEKNIMLQTGFNPYNQTHKMSLVKHGNGRDWWLALPAYPIDGGIDSFGNPLIIYLFLISPDTIKLYTTFEGVIYEDQNSVSTTGQSKFTTAGSMFGMAHGKSIILYSFDRCSGIFNHYYTIDSIFSGNPGDYINGLEFSPNGSKLYATKSGGYSNGISKLFQFDLTVTEIQNSKIILNQDSLDYTYSQLQLAPNGKIYCAMPHDGPEYYSYEEPQNLSLSVIHNPNGAGEACNYEHLGQYMYGKKITLGLPNMPNYNLGVLHKSACDTLSTSIASINYNSSFSISPNPAQSMFYIKAKQQTAALYTLQIMDLQGKEVLHLPKYISGNTITVTNLPEGMYAVLLSDETGNMWQEKLVISR